MFQGRLLRSIYSSRKFATRPVTSKFHPKTGHSEFFLPPIIGAAHLKNRPTQPELSSPSIPMASSSQEPLRKKPRLDDPQDLPVLAKNPTETPPIAIFAKGKRSKRKHRRPEFPVDEHGSDGVLWRDILSVIGPENAKSIIEQGKDWEPPSNLRIKKDVRTRSNEEPEIYTDFPDSVEINVQVVKLGYHGEAIGYPMPDGTEEHPARNPNPNWVIVFPFALPAEVCRVLVYSNSRLHSSARMLDVISTPSTMAIGKPFEKNPGSLPLDPKYLRDESLIKCPHFMTCGGCQLQFLPYSSQLELKRDALVTAYTEFFAYPNPPLDKIAAQVHPSPLQYGYRTKLTPHFDPVPRAVLQYMGKSQQSRSRPTAQVGFGLRDAHTQKSVKGWNPEDYSVPNTSSLMVGDDNRKVLDQMRSNKFGDDSYSPDSFTAEIDAMKIRAVDEQPLHHGQKPSWLKIGFTSERNFILDIEECPLATGEMNKAYKADRKNIARSIYKYENGVTLLYRHSLDQSTPLRESRKTEHINSFTPSPPGSPKMVNQELKFEELCITDQKKPVREKIGDYYFEYNAGTFFQCNSSILEELIDYVRTSIFSHESDKLTHLVDTYCGAGLFAISLYPHFEAIAGIELSADSIHFAKHNAWINAMDSGRVRFQDGDATDIFAGLRRKYQPPARDSFRYKPWKQPSQAKISRDANFPGILHEPPLDSPVAQPFPPQNSVVIIDPPRKGTSPDFISQLLSFGPQKIIYVSCNPVTQARDIGWIINDTSAGGSDPCARKFTYEIEGIQGFDLFPQTTHVESVAILRRVEI